MPITATDFFKPGSTYVPYLLEDIYLKGGYRVMPTIAARDEYIQHAKSIAWLPQMDSRKEGMMCYVVEDKAIYTLEADLESWKVLEISGSVEVSDPLQFIDNILRVDPAYLIPDGGKAGDVLTRALNGTALWQTLPLAQGMRGSIDYTVPTLIASGAEHKVDFEMPATVMLLRVEVSAPEIKIEGWSSPLPAEQNPYTFISSETQLYDEGIRDQNGEETKFRRYSFMANQEEPVQNRQYFTITNLGPVDVMPTLKIMYLSLQ